MSDNQRLALGIGGFVALTAATIGSALWFNSMACSARWSDFDHQWGVVSGCRVKIDGRWMPDDRVREVDL